MNNMTPSTRQEGPRQGCFAVSEDTVHIGAWVEWDDKGEFLKHLRETKRWAQRTKNQAEDDEIDPQMDDNSSNMTSYEATDGFLDVYDSILEESFGGGDVEPDFSDVGVDRPSVHSGDVEWIVSPQGWGGGARKIYYD